MSKVPKPALRQGELVALLAMLAATVAFSIDAMLPALPDIAEALSPGEPNKAQLVIATFVVALGIGTIFAGPLSDAFGRKPVALCGGAIYTLGALLAVYAPNLEMLLMARALQGLGAAGPRVVGVAIARDLYSGRQMARIVSFVMTIFTLVPMFAPSLGALIIWGFGWRAIFWAFAVFSVISLSWLAMRQPETLGPENRRPFRVARLLDGAKEILTHRQVIFSVALQTMIYAMLFTAIISSQPVFDQVFGQAASFPLWFGAIAAVAATANLLNAAIVVRFGMRRVVQAALFGLLGITALYVLLLTLGPDSLQFAGFVIWLGAIFYMAGLGIGNTNAIALEPMGHIAGMAAAITSSAATILSLAIAVPVGLFFNGTPVPMVIGVLFATVAGLAFLTQIIDTEAEPALVRS